MTDYTVVQFENLSGSVHLNSVMEAEFRNKLVESYGDSILVHREA